MSGVSRNSKKFYSVRPCQLYDLNTNVRLMIMNHLKNKSLFIYNVVRHRESIQPLTKNTIPICCMRKRFSKIIMEERIVPLTQMHRCPVICPDAKRLLICMLTFKAKHFLSTFFFDRPASLVTIKDFTRLVFNFKPCHTFRTESRSKYCLMIVSLDILFRDRSCT